MGAWDDWELEVDALHDAGDKVVALVRQHGRSKTAGTAVEMSFAQIWTLRDGKQTRMTCTPTEMALEAAGLRDQSGDTLPCPRHLRRLDGLSHVRSGNR